MKQFCDILPEVDVLILGAGLAGLRAGLSALGMLGRPMGASVLCVGSGHVAAGSSFANPNNALGMQVLFGDFEAADFVARAEAVAPPGVLDPSLLRIMARESLHRMEELMVCGVPFRGREKGINGILKARVPACFLPELPSSAVFEHLGQAYAALSSDFRRFGGRLMEGTQCLGLLQVPADSGHAVAGALLRLPKRQDPVMQPARTVILALGGPAPLFAHNIAGPKVSGWSYALLERAGAELLQPGFVQFLWYGLDPLQYLSLRNLVHEGWQVLTPASNGNATQEERWEGIPPELAPLADARGTHCPCAYGSEDNALDRFLLQRRNADGVVLVRQPKSDRAMAVAAVANAGNGGARIDEHGRTTVPGLYACGECASGMHGANRVGGAMVLASQVFGHRAGTHAAQEARQRPRVRWEELRLCPSPGRTETEDTPFAALAHPDDPELAPWLGRMLQRNVLCGGGRAQLETLPQALLDLEARLQGPLVMEDRLRCETARLLLQHHLDYRSARTASAGS